MYESYSICGNLTFFLFLRRSASDTSTGLSEKFCELSLNSIGRRHSGVTNKSALLSNFCGGFDFGELPETETRDLLSLEKFKQDRSAKFQFLGEKSEFSGDKLVFSLSLMGLLKLSSLIDLSLIIIVLLFGFSWLLTIFTRFFMLPLTMLSSSKSMQIGGLFVKCEEVISLISSIFLSSTFTCLILFIKSSKMSSVAFVFSSVVFFVPVFSFRLLIQKIKLYHVQVKV